jgi:hypothetical protein
MTLLEIPSHLTNCAEQNIHFAYEKYKAYLYATQTLLMRISEGTLPGKKTIVNWSYRDFPFEVDVVLPLQASIFQGFKLSFDDRMVGQRWQAIWFGSLGCLKSSLFTDRFMEICG